MEKKLLGPCICMMILLFGSKFAHAQFKIETQYRPRFEIRDGYRKLAEKGSVPACIISQRLRLSFIYTNENIKIKITPQDVRIWGNEQTVTSTGVFGNNASLDLFEGYAEIRIAKPMWISVGRQQLVYDEQRLLASRNWNQKGISYDALVLKLNFNEWSVHIGGSWNSSGEIYSDNFYPSDRIKSLDFLWIENRSRQKFQLSFLQVASGVTQNDSTNKINFRHSSGIYAICRLGQFQLKGNTIYQYGKSKTDQNVSAFFIELNAAYNIKFFTVNIGFNYLSGNRHTGNKTDRLFDVLYGARHRFFGEMDYFTNFPKQTKDGGLVDYFGILSFRITKSFELSNTGHYFQLAQTNASTPPDKNLGYENDLILNYKFSDWGSLKGGYLFYLPTSSLKELQGITDNKFSQFFYLELTVKPIIFKQKT